MRDWTHNVQLWLTNDYGYYQHIQETIKDICSWAEFDRDDPQTSIDDAVAQLSDHMQTYWDDLLDEEALDLSPVFKEILYREWDQVDFSRIAEYYAEEIADTFAELDPTLREAWS